MAIAPRNDGWLKFLRKFVIREILVIFSQTIANTYIFFVCFFSWTIADILYGWQQWMSLRNDGWPKFLRKIVIREKSHQWHCHFLIKDINITVIKKDANDKFKWLEKWNWSEYTTTPISSRIPQKKLIIRFNHVRPPSCPCIFSPKNKKYEKKRYL